MTEPVQQANEAAQTFAQATDSGPKSAKVQVVSIQESDPWKSLTATPKMIASVLAVVLLTYFFMVFGENLQRNAIALLPTRPRKKLTVDILQAIEREISRYVLTITLINTAVGMILAGRSEEHTSELQSLMRISYAVFCLKTKKQHTVDRIEHLYT